jgi:hypothetical protein
MINTMFGWASGTAAWAKTVRASSVSQVRRRGRDRLAERADLVKDGNHRMANLLESLWWFAIQWKDIASSAQTERRGGAGPVRSLA